VTLNLAVTTAVIRKIYFDGGQHILIRIHQMAHHELHAYRRQHEGQWCHLQFCRV